MGHLVCASLVRTGKHFTQTNSAEVNPSCIIGPAIFASKRVLRSHSKRSVKVCSGLHLHAIIPASIVELKPYLRSKTKE